MTIDRKSRSLRDWAADIVTILVAVAAILLAGSHVWQQIGNDARPPNNGAFDDREVPDWEQVAASGHRVGPESAKVTIVEFGDYECPYCRRAERALRTLRETHTEDLAVVYRHFPLSSHPNAYTAARLAECGAQQEWFEPVHELLMNAIDLGRLDPQRVGAEVRVPDPARFVRCVDGVDEIPQIAADRAEGEKLGIQFVPTFIIQGTMLGRSPDSAGLSDLVRRYLTENQG